jgi:DNA-binding MarR family transcriptional regulator
MLTLIAENPGVSARHLAKALAVTPPNITLWVDKLSERGLVQRERSTTDGRAQHLSTTEAGTTLARQAVKALRDAERAALSQGLSAAEQAILAELLHKLARCRQKG